MVIWVNLSKETFTEEYVPIELYYQLFDDFGLAAKFIYENMSDNYQDFHLFQ